MSGVVTRFAPSPTGSIHVGNTRSAIWNYLFARHNKGKLILRIEDTDLARSKREDEMELRANLEWLGLTFDEGNLPNAIRQSERLEIYKEYAHKLLKEGKAFACFCSDEELTQKREKATAEKRPPIYDGKCKSLSQTEIDERVKNGENFAIRLHVAQEDIHMDDMIKGHVVMKKGMFGDFIILRSNGVAVYNFCVTVDDILMGVTHIMRAQEHLTNAAKQILVYKALEAPIPTMGHTPLLLAPDGSKLSKRHGATSLQEYRRLGYLKEAIINYLATLGFTPNTDKEKLSMPELIELFTPERITKGSSKFDIQKFRFINSLYIKELPISERNKLVMPYMEESFSNLKEYTSEQIEKIFELTAGGLEFLAQIIELTGFFFNDDFDTDRDWEKTHYKDIFPKLEAIVNSLTDDFTAKDIEIKIKEIGQELGIKGKDLFMPIRMFTTGQEHGPSMYETFELLGKQRILKRLAIWKPCL